MADSLLIHGACLGLTTADYLARAWRIQLLTRGVGYPLKFGDAMAVNLIGDAACALTPLRLAGEPARLGVMLSAGLPPAASLVAITYEVLTAWPVILLSAGVLLAHHAPDWWQVAGPGFAQGLREAWPWVVAVLGATVAAWAWLRRRAPAASHHLRRPLTRMLVHWRRMPWPLLLATAPLSFINLAARVAVLPVLASSLPDAPPLELLLVGSFALLYSQLVIPTPSGAGAVELGFLGGAAGDLAGSGASLLLAWRLYTTGIGVFLGVAVAARRFGWSVVRDWFRRPTSPG